MTTTEPILQINPTTQCETPTSMRALVQDTYGGPDVLSLRTIPTPAPAPGQVLLRVHAAGIDRGTVHQVSGLPYLIRLAGYGLRRPSRPTPGLDVAGTIVAVGTEVDRFAIGDRVAGFAHGSLAEYAVANPDKLAHVPDNVRLDDAAVASVSGTTALQALTSVGNVAAGDRVLVIGASGAVGSFAVQIAAHLGARVTGVASAANLDLVRRLGAHHTVDYRTTDITGLDTEFDLVIDTAGRLPLRRLRRILPWTGTLVIVGGEGGGRFTGGVGRQLRAFLLSRIVPQRLTRFVSREHHDDVACLLDLLAEGSVLPHVGQRHTLADGAEAIQAVASGRASGKTLITIAEGDR